jgi:trigger factor
MAKKKTQPAEAATEKHEHDHDHDHDHEHEHEHEHGHEHGHEHEHGHHHHHDDEKFKFVEDPVFDVNYKGECQYEVKVTVPIANERKKAEEMYSELKDEAEIPGFRRGRAPVKLIERKFGKAVKGEVAAKLVSAAYEKLIEDQKLKPYGYPDIDGMENNKDRPADQPIEFTLKFEVAPRVELGKYRGVEVERPVVTVDENDIDEAVEELRDRQSTYEPTKKNAKAKVGDQVIIDFKGTVNGEEFKGGSAENYPYVLGSKRFFPEFEDALKGKSPESDTECTVTFPGDYFAEDLRGKQAEFTIKINEVKRKKKPEVNDDLAKEAGFENVGDMRAKIRENLGKNSIERSRAIAEARGLDAVVDASKFEIPPRLIEGVAQEHMQSALQRLIQQGLPREEFQKRMADLEPETRESAVRAIKRMVVLGEIGEAEGIEVTDEDLDKEAAVISSSMGADAEMVAQYLRQGENRGSFIDRLYRQKAVAVIMDNAKITDKELTREALEKEAAEVEGETDDADAD